MCEEEKASGGESLLHCLKLFSCSGRRSATEQVGRLRAISDERVSCYVRRAELALRPLPSPRVWQGLQSQDGGAHSPVSAHTVFRPN